MRRAGITIKFQYKASNRSGQTIEGVIDAVDTHSVLSALREKSLYPLDINEVSATQNSLNMELGSKKLPKKVLTVFCQQFATILKAGVPLVQALDILKDQSENKKLANVIATMNDDIKTGKNLSTTMQAQGEFFPNILIKMVEAGELSGTLDNSLERMATQFEKENKINQKVKTAMTYPIFVATLAVCIVIGLLVFIVPQFTSLFDQIGAELPSMTRMLLAFSDFLISSWYSIILVTIILVILIRAYFKSEQGRLKLDKAKLKMPIIKKLNLKLVAARFSRTLCTLTTAGMSLPECLSITAKSVSNKLVETGLMDVKEDVKSGESLSDSLNKLNVFPILTIHMTRIGEETGMLEYMLQKSADYYETETESAIQKLTSLLEPLMILVVGGIVLFIALAILLPVFQMGSSINQSMH